MCLLCLERRLCYASPIGLGKRSACHTTPAQGGQQITCTNFPQNPPRALQDGVGLVGIHTLYSYFWVDLKSFKAENATAFDQFESNWSEKLSACCATAAQGGHQTCAKIKSVPLERRFNFRACLVPTLSCCCTTH